MDTYRTDDIIYALATGWVRSALAVIRISGKGCIARFAPVFTASQKLLSAQNGTLVYGEVKEIDQVVVSVYRDGHGYTGEEALEISCHGSLVGIQKLLDMCGRLGFRQAGRGEFTYRAFAHGRMDLTQAEAVEELVDSMSDKGQSQALGRLKGSLKMKLAEVRKRFLQAMAAIEVQLDYSEDEIGEDLTFPMDKLDSAIEALGTIHDSYNAGRLYSQGARIVLAGPSNAGKSSLFNYFLKEERSIVSAQKGTTRDFIEAMCTIRGIPIRLYDTAGFRDLSESEIEEEGIRRSRNLVEGADIILYLVDSTDLLEIDRTVVQDPRCIPVLNKVDLKDSNLEGFLKLSVATGLGFNELCDRIYEKLTSDIAQSDDGSIVIENERQRENLARAMASLRSAKLAVESELPLDIVSMDIQEALEALGELTGEVTTDDILDRIFSSFCVGK
ncbi:MAG TPA: tRNA uridine-5-carboxymethylaminomethyl(34) synthesis GTPase MnmE [Sphaerochaeta sp.]|nr:tRNA uridine-5-carboxymethylaminomethyl(34) synthesis GTPase MnmE [Sphaerochaeta sp.]